MNLLILFYNDDLFSNDTDDLSLLNRFAKVGKGLPFKNSQMVVMDNEDVYKMEDYFKISSSNSSVLLIVQDFLLFEESVNQIVQDPIGMESFESVEKQITLLGQKLNDECKVFLIQHHGTAWVQNEKEEDNDFKLTRLELIFKDKLLAHCSESNDYPCISEMIKNVIQFYGPNNGSKEKFSEIIQDAIDCSFKREINLTLNFVRDLSKKLKAKDTLIKEIWEKYKIEIDEFEVITSDKLEELDILFSKVESLATSDPRAAYKEFKKELLKIILPTQPQPDDRNYLE